MVNDVFSSSWAQSIFLQKYSKDGKETWAETCLRVVENVCGTLISSEHKNTIYQIMVSRKFIPGGRYLYSAGRSFHQYNNCFLLRAEDSREGWSDLLAKASSMLMTGGGIGIDYSLVREEGALIKRTGGQATGPISLMNMINEVGRHVMQGGQRRSAIWAGLNWNHPDINKFLELKNHSEDLKALKQKDLNFALPMELTNISVNYDRLFFDIIKDGPGSLFYDSAIDVFKKNCLQAFSTAEPGMAFNYRNSNESLRNACTEVVSEDDSDKCNLGTIWLPRIESKEELAHVVSYANLFLLCGGISSDLPTEKTREVGLINNRIGLGLGGIAHWLMERGQPYAVTDDFREWLYVYETVSDDTAKKWADVLGVKEPKGKRAIAPNGTIGILAETTTGIEPLFCAAYKRRYFKDGAWQYQYVVDGTVKSLISQGIKPEAIYDSYGLDFETRVAFQADVQDYVDMAISSTCNMSSWGSESNNLTTVDKNAGILLKYAPRLRGFTCYPDGCRSGQPLTAVDLRFALEQEGRVFEEKIQECTNGVCGL